MLKSKKAQLGPIEAKFFLIGFLIGIVIAIVLIILSTRGVIPLGFLKSIVC